MGLFRKTITLVPKHVAVVSLRPLGHNAGVATDSRAKAGVKTSESLSARKVRHQGFGIFAFSTENWSVLRMSRLPDDDAGNSLKPNGDRFASNDIVVFGKKTKLSAKNIEILERMIGESKTAKAWFSISVSTTVRRELKAFKSIAIVSRRIIRQEYLRALIDYGCIQRHR